MKKEKALRLAEKYVITGRFELAAAEYKKVLAAEGNDTTLLNTTGDLLLKCGATAEALKLFRKVTQIYLDSGFVHKAIAMYKKVLRLEPDDIRSREMLSSLYDRLGLRYEAARQLQLLIDYHEHSNDIDQVLVYLKRLSEIDPEDAGLWVKQARLLAERAKPRESVDHFLRALRLYQETQNAETVFELACEALQADSRNRELLSIYVKTADDLGSLRTAEEYLREQAETTGEEFPYYLILAQIAERRGDLEGAGRLYSALQADGYEDPLISEGLVRTGWVDDDLSSMLLDSQFPMDDLDEEPETASEDRFETDSESHSRGSVIPWPGAEEEEAEESEASGVFSGIEEDENSSGIFRMDEDRPEGRDREQLEEQVESVDLGDEGVASLDESLEEADFYLKLGFKDDARALLEKLLDQFPGEERVLRRARKVMVLSDELINASVSGERLAQFDLDVESALESLFSGDGSGDVVDEVLRYDVTSGNGSDGTNPEVHYDLGLAYKEMGLLEDAVQEFVKANELAIEQDHIPQRILCCSMLASSLQELGRFEEASDWAARGLELPGMKDFEWKALKYDLAIALENQGKPREALSEFQSILDQDAEYRDVQDRLRDLRADAS